MNTSRRLEAKLNRRTAIARPLNRRVAMMVGCFLAFPLAGYTQSAINSGATISSNGGLPLRNLLIEVRQVEQDSRASERIGITPQVQAQPGQSGARLDVQIGSQQQSQNVTSRQQVLVLNGRPANIVLRNTAPLRLLQMVRVGGVWRTVPGVVFLDANTGFEALARWDGSNSVAVSLQASQGRNPLGGTSSSTSTELVLPLEEWTTVAESEQDQDNQQSGVGSVTGSGRSNSRNALSVQLRISVR